MWGRVVGAEFIPPVVATPMCRTLKHPAREKPSALKALFTAPLVGFLFCPSRMALACGGVGLLAIADGQKPVPTRCRVEDGFTASPPS